MTPMDIKELFIDLSKILRKITDELEALNERVKKLERMMKNGNQ